MSCVFLQKSVRKIVRSAAGVLKFGTAGHLVDSAVRLLNGGVGQLCAQAGLHIIDVLAAQGLLLCLFGLGQAGGLALFCQLVDAGDLFLCHGASCIFKRNML